MYEVKVNGNNLAELKTNVKNLNEELNGGGELETTHAKVIIEELSPVFDPAVEEISEPVEEVIKEAMIEAPAQVVNNSEKDVRGLPWDARIHSSKMTKTKTGVWKNLRGVDKGLLAQVEAELSNAITLPSGMTVDTSVVAAPIVEAPVVAAPIVEAPVVAAPIPALPSMNVSNAHSVESFVTGFPMVIASLITQGKVTQDYIQQLNDWFKVDQIVNISEEQKAQVFEQFVGMKIVTKV